MTPTVSPASYPQAQSRRALAGQVISVDLAQWLHQWATAEGVAPEGAWPLLQAALTPQRRWIVPSCCSATWWDTLTAAVRLSATGGIPALATGPCFAPSWGDEPNNVQAKKLPRAGTPKEAGSNRRERMPREAVEEWMQRAHHVLWVESAMTAGPSVIALVINLLQLSPSPYLTSNAIIRVLRKQHLNAQLPLWAQIRTGSLLKSGRDVINRAEQLQKWYASGEASHLRALLMSPEKASREWGARLAGLSTATPSVSEHASEQENSLILATA